MKGAVHKVVIQKRASSSSYVFKSLCQVAVSSPSDTHRYGLEGGRG